MEIGNTEKKASVFCMMSYEIVKKNLIGVKRLWRFLLGVEPIWLTVSDAPV